MIPTNNTIKRFRIGPALPTAASALSPTKLPTTTLSTVLYSCWAILPINMGTVKIRIFSQGFPTVMSTGANNFFKYSIIRYLLPFFVLYKLLPPVKKVGCQELLSCQPTLSIYILTRYAKILQAYFSLFKRKRAATKRDSPLSCYSKMGEIYYLWTRPEASPPASFATSSIDTML